ncbi:MAG: hypothetical protein NTX25_05595, partial [Proteobacteria bacterium]|nr:hypothetical protein [Pseudomonadota bacterium]
MLQIAMHAIRDRKANVLVIGADNARAVICKLFQELEFPNVVYDRSIKLAQHRLKTEIFQLVVFDTFYAVNGDPTSDLNGIVQFLRTTRTLASAPLTIVLSPAPRIQGLKAAYAEGLLASPICASVSA